MTALHWRDATDLARAIRRREATCVDVMQAFLSRIRRLDPLLNAFLFRIPDQEALRLAAAADLRIARGESIGPLHGLPIAIKDLMDVAGMPTSFGTEVGTEVAPRDSLLAERVRASGAIIIGKTNTPEHGLGALTFNKLREPARNPWDRSRHAGGSSGGAATALAAGMLPLADGSDSGGSIRYPASFCNLVGLRPSPGRVPTARVFDGWSPHALLGPMARNARDAGLLLSVLAGRDPRAPLSLEGDPAIFASLDPIPLPGLRIGWSRTLGGLPIDAEVMAVLESMRVTLTDAGCVVRDWEPEWPDADRCWEIIEMHEFMAGSAQDVQRNARRLRPELVANVAVGLSQSAAEIAWAQIERTRIYRRTAAEFEHFDFLVAPAAPVVAPPVECEWVQQIHDVELHRYFEWQRCASRVTVTAHPVISIPAGFSKQGLPVGMQVLARDHGEHALLNFAAALEQLNGFAHRRPPPLTGGT